MAKKTQKPMHCRFLHSLAKAQRGKVTQRRQKQNKVLGSEGYHLLAFGLSSLRNFAPLRETSFS